MNRRRFLKMLASLPLVGLLPGVGKAASEPKVYQIGVDGFGPVAEIHQGANSWAIVDTRPAEQSHLSGVVEKVEGDQAWVRVGSWGEIKPPMTLSPAATELVTDSDGNVLYTTITGFNHLT